MEVHCGFGKTTLAQTFFNGLALILTHDVNHSIKHKTINATK